MSQSQVISFRASGHFLNWIEAQRLEDESPSQAAMRVLKELSGGNVDLSTPVSTPVSTPSIDSFVSTEVSTSIAEIVDTSVAAKLDPVLDRLAVLEERLGKLRA